MKAWVVMEKGFEYNDEIYSQSESEGGHPKKIFFTQEGCLQEVSKLNIKWFKSEDITQYTYNMEDICDDTEKLLTLCNSLNEKYGKNQPKNRWNSASEYQLNSNSNEEESEQYQKMIKFSFFSAVEVEIDQQDLRESHLRKILD
jgi:hypothetical protein